MKRFITPVLVWKSFIYRCRECGHEVIMNLQVGVEGPGRNDYIPSPFSISCPKGCKSFCSMEHVDWHKDKAYTIRPAEKGEYVFVVDKEVNCATPVEIVNDKLWTAKLRFLGSAKNKLDLVNAQVSKMSIEKLAQENEFLSHCAEAFKGLKSEIGDMEKIDTEKVRNHQLSELSAQVAHVATGFPIIWEDEYNLGSKIPYIVDFDAVRDGCTTTTTMIGARWINHTANGEMSKIYARRVPQYSKSLDCFREIEKKILKDGDYQKFLGSLACQLGHNDVDDLMLASAEDKCKAYLMMKEGGEVKNDSK